VWAWWLRLRGDPITAGLVEDWRSRTVREQWELVAKREEVRRRWFEYFAEKKCEFVIMPPHPLPAVPRGAGRDTVAACGYTFLWNLLDYTAGVMPVGRVDADLDGKGDGVTLANGVARKAWRVYDAEKMRGLPTAVQVVGGRLEEEKVLRGMERVEEALRRRGGGWKPVEVEVE
jgi:Asp-tRNA(Asn)/Glu-tRNA(Gln) amidotransferase A subunit family amidase